MEEKEVNKKTNKPIFVMLFILIIIFITYGIINAIIFNKNKTTDLKLVAVRWYMPMEWTDFYCGKALFNDGTIYEWWIEGRKRTEDTYKDIQWIQTHATKINKRVSPIEMEIIKKQIEKVFEEKQVSTISKSLIEDSGIKVIKTINYNNSFLDEKLVFKNNNNAHVEKLLSRNGNPKVVAKDGIISIFNSNNKEIYYKDFGMFDYESCNKNEQKLIKQLNKYLEFDFPKITK